MRLSKRFGIASRLALGLYLLACALLVSISALALPIVPSEQYLGSSIISIEMPLLFTGLGTVWLAGLETTKIWVNVLALGFVSTMISSLRAVSNRPPLVGCAILFSEHGFPLPWFRAATFYVSQGGPLCHFPMIPSPRVDAIAFLLDTVFYFGLYFAVLEICRSVSSLNQKNLRWQEYANRACDHSSGIIRYRVRYSY